MSPTAVPPARRFAEPAEQHATRVIRPDRVIARLACRQDGMVATRQLLAAGLTRRHLSHRVGTGLLIPWLHGVYAVGHPPVTFRAVLTGALLAIGDDAAVDAESAIRLHGFWPRDDGPPPGVDVVVARGLKPRAGVRLRCVRELPPAEWTRRGGLRVVAPEQALLGLAARGAPAGLVRAALRRGYVERRTSVPRMRRTLERHAGRPGVARLRRLVEEGFKPTRSELEDAATDLLEERGIAGWAVNARVVLPDGRALECDFVFRAQRVVVEVDGGRFHDDPLSRADDRARQAALEAAGWRVLRLTWDQVARRRAETARRVHHILEPVERDA